MRTWIIVIVIFLIPIFCLLKHYGKIKLGWIVDLVARFTEFLSPKGETLIKKIKDQTLAEKEKSKELTKVLEAKKELARAKSANSKLRREIAKVKEADMDKAEDVPVKTRWMG